METLQSLRKSVSKDKDALVEEVARLKLDLQSAEDKTAMQIAQVS